MTSCLGLVANPGDYGVLEIDEYERVISIEEKPKTPKSNLAVPGLYFYDQQVCDFAQRLVPFSRGELEISDLNEIYLREDLLRVRLLPRGVAWMDAGTIDDLSDAANYVRAVQKREGRRIGCPEEAAIHLGFLKPEDLSQALRSLPQSSYRDYLEGLASEGSIVE